MIETYYISLKLGENGKQDFRWSYLTKSISDISEEYWTDQTSCILFDTDEPEIQIMSIIKECIDGDLDFVLLGNVKQKTMKITGNMDDHEKDRIKKVIPFVEIF